MTTLGRPIPHRATLAALVVALALAAGASARPPARDITVTQQTPAGATPHFPAFDAGSGDVLVSNVSAGTVTEVAPGAGPVRAFAAGSQPHTVVVDAPRRRAYVADKGSSTVSVLDLATGATLATFPVGPNPHGLALDPSRGRLYVTSIDADRVEAYDLRTHALIASASVGDGPWGVDVRGSMLAVADTAGSTIHLLDADTLAVRDVVEVGAGPWNVKIGRKGTVYATLERAGAVAAVKDGRLRWTTPVGSSPHGLVVDEARHVVLAAVTGANAVAILEPRSGRLLQSVPVASAPAGMAYDPGGGRAYAAAQGAGLVVTLEAQRRSR